MIKSLSTLKKILKYILPLVSKDFNIETFKIYLLGLILQERWFSAHGISKNEMIKEKNAIWLLNLELAGNKVMNGLQKKVNVAMKL